MKKFLLILLLLIIVLPAYSDATWQEIQSKNKILYIDTSSISNQDTQYLYWVKNNTPKGYKKMLMKSDCSNNLTGVQKLLIYNNENKVIKTEDINQDMTYVVPDSDAQTVYNYICNIHKQTQSEANKKKNSVTPNKLFNTINSINNASYEVRSIKNNALNIINGF